MLDYRVIANTNRNFGTGGSQTNSIQAYGTVGANWDAWRFRGDYQAQSNVGNTAYADRTFRFSRLYAFRALPSIQSTVTFGDDYLTSDIFDTFALTGASIRSDDRMLPPSLRGYAPLISGVARTNATVTVSQAGRVLYVTRVSPGAFALQNINTSVQGTLDVAVEEEDGSVQRFQVTTAAVPFLARAGQLRYKAAVGKPRQFGGAGITPFFGFGEIAYGLPFDVTAYGGFIAASGYTSIALGVGRDFGAFGALSADVTHARAKLWWNGATRNGNSYRINYSKHFDGLDADVRFFGYRFSEREYTNFAQFSGDPTAYGLANSKQRYSATLSKRFGDTSTYFSYDQTTYWERANEQRVGLTLTRAFSIGTLRNLNVSVSAFRTQSAGASGNQVSVTATLPIGGRHTVTSNLTTGSGSTSVNAGYIYDDPDGRTYQVNAGATDGRASANASYRQRSSAYQLTAQASTLANAYAAASLEVDGSFVATQYGVSAHANGNAGDTRLLVSTDGVPDVPLSGTLAYRFARLCGARRHLAVQRVRRDRQRREAAARSAGDEPDPAHGADRRRDRLREVFRRARQQPVPDADRPDRQAAAVRGIGAGRGERQGTRHRRRGRCGVPDPGSAEIHAGGAGGRTHALHDRHAAEPAPTRRHADSGDVPDTRRVACSGCAGRTMNSRIQR